MKTENVIFEDRKTVVVFIFCKKDWS